jgi:hypothetical protein
VVGGQIWQCGLLNAFSFTGLLQQRAREVQSEKLLRSQKPQKAEPKRSEVESGYRTGNLCLHCATAPSSEEQPDSPIPAMPRTHAQHLMDFTYRACNSSISRLIASALGFVDVAYIGLVILQRLAAQPPNLPLVLPSFLVLWYCQV